MRNAKPEQKPSSRQRHRLLASNAESRIRLIVLLTAPKIFAISSITDKTLATVSQDCRLGGLIGRDTHTQNETLFVLINGSCLFGAWSRKSATVSSAELDEKYKRLCRIVAKQAHKAQ